MTSTISVSCQPDSISFLPNSDDILVATYTYSEGVRNGGLMLLQLVECVSNKCNYQNNSHLELNCGILHAKPHLINGKNYAICAASDGSIKFARLDKSISIAGSTIIDSNALVLSVCKDSMSERVAGGLSSGKIAIIDQDKVIHSWPGHDLEVWACYMDGNLVYTGSDDSKLRIWDTNKLSNNLNNYVAEIKSFGAGVTWISTSDNEIIAGSHDNYLTWFDKRLLSCELRRIKLPGSPWKLVFDNSIFFVAVCQALVYAFTYEDEMADKVVKINEKLDNVFKSLPKTDQNPLIYSIDVRNNVLVATDFYNKRLIVTDIGI